jgi:hypothetical protein
MAGCCGIKTLVARIKADAVGNPIINEEDFVMVEYTGGNLQKHQVGSPTQVLRREYGFQKNHYGQHKHGDVFAIHRDDLKKAPKLFREVKEEVVENQTNEDDEPEVPVKSEQKAEGDEPQSPAQTEPKADTPKDKPQSRSSGTTNKNK